ncbi:hypothetical protein [Krasilnikovia sp. MM14-A1004]|uniref:hypothetical protein n=1 Tax=Krasilnikovia sp. MM14-A1004 TaxID=3373541 RepID=UPI00399C4D52
MSLPPIAAGVTAEAVAALPTRLRGKLDAAVDQARGWPIAREGAIVTVRPDDRTVVTLTTPVTEPGDATCSCLLAPRCLHRAAVLSAAPVLTDDPDSSPPLTAPMDPPPSGTAQAPAQLAGTKTASEISPAVTGMPTGSATPGSAKPGSAKPGSAKTGSAKTGSVKSSGQVTSAQAGAASGLWSAAAAVLSTGIPGAGAVARADVLRGVHQARAAGLHAPAATAVRVVEHLRAAQRDDPSFRLADLTNDLRDLLVSCHRLTTGDATAAGVARRDYEPVGDLRLSGLFCEPVRAATGHAGAVTYLADARGRIWLVSDVKPANPEVAVSAARASVELGEVRLSHHDLSRSGLLAVNAHASAAGRLSHGRDRRAVAAPGTGWFDPPLDALWRADPAAQADRWLAATTVAPHERPAASDLAFLDGVVLGADHRGLLLAVGEGAGAADRGERSGQHGHDLVVAATAPHDDPALPYVVNLRQLAAHAAGHPIRLVARFSGVRRVAALAFAADWLPSRHGGHVDLGTTTLTRADLPGAGPVPAATDDDPPPPPLHLVRHQLERVVAAGRTALLSGVDDGAGRLTAAHLGAAASVLAELRAAGVRRTRDVFGRLDPHDADGLARAWLVAAVYEQAAAQVVTWSAWQARTATVTLA